MHQSKKKGAPPARGGLAEYCGRCEQCASLRRSLASNTECSGNSEAGEGAAGGGSCCVGRECSGFLRALR